MRFRREDWTANSSRNGDAESGCRSEPPPFDYPATTWPASAAVEVAPAALKMM
jgi:hypothetical protein